MAFSHPLSGAHHGLLNSLPHDVLINIFERVPQPDQLAAAEADKRLGSAIAHTRRSPLRAIDHTSTTPLARVEPALPRALFDQTALHMHAAGSHLRVLRLHPGFSSAAVGLLLKRACCNCPCIESLAFRDEGAITSPLVVQFMCSFRKLKTLEIVRSGPLIPSHSDDLPGTLKQLVLHDPLPKVLNMTIVNEVSRQEKHVHVDVMFSKEFLTTHKFVGDFFSFSRSVKSPLVLLRGRISSLRVDFGSVFVSVKKTVQIRIRDVALAVWPHCPIDLINIIRFASNTEEQEKLSQPASQRSLSAMIREHHICVTPLQLEALRHLDMDRHSGWRDVLVSRMDLYYEILARLGVEATGISEVTVRYPLHPSGPGFGIQMFQMACTVLEQHETVHIVNISRELLSKCYMSALQNFLSACKNVIVMRLCEPEAGSMLDFGSSECLFTELYGIPAFLQLLNIACPRLEVLYVERASKSAVPLRNIPAEKFYAAWKALEDYQACRPEVDISTLRFQVEEWSEEFRRSQSVGETRHNNHAYVTCSEKKGLELPTEVCAEDPPENWFRRATSFCRKQVRSMTMGSMRVSEIIGNLFSSD